MAVIPRRRFLHLPGHALAVLALGSGLPIRAGAASAATSLEVRLLHHRFVPDPIRARPGERITFRNDDAALHSVVLVGREDVLEETFIDPGERHTLVLPGDLAPGSYQLACTVHIDMRARLVVG